MKVTQPRYSLHKRARIRAFFAEGVEKSYLPLVVEALPTLLHLSLFLFFAGLVVFLWNVDLTIYKMVLSWIGVFSALYGCATVIPLFRGDSPYYTPLTPLARVIALVALSAYIVLRALFMILVNCCFCDSCLGVLWGIAISTIHRSWLGQVLKRMLKTPEEVALESPSEIVTRAFMWTFDSLDEDHELDRFFSNLPGFRTSKVVDDPLPTLTEMKKEKLFGTLLRFLDLTFSSDLLPKDVKIQRAIMCAKACDVAEFSFVSGRRLYDKVIQFWYSGLQTTNFGTIANDSRTENTELLQAIVTTLVAGPQRRDDSWFRHIAPIALGIPETVIRDYAASGDSLSLAILIYIVRHHLSHFRHSSWVEFGFRKTLEANSDFNAEDTSPKLRHEFCALWNQVVLKAQNDRDRWMAALILRPIRYIYITLHRNTDSAPTQFSASTRDVDAILDEPSSYPVCNVAGHVHDDSASAPFAETVLQNATVLAPDPLSSLDAPSSSIPAQPHVIGSTTDVPLFDNFRPDQTITESRRIPSTSAGLSTASVIGDVGGSGITMTPHPAPEISTSAPLSSGSPPAAVALRHNSDLSTPSEPPNLPTLASSNPVLDNILPTGVSLSSPSPIT
ncbi:hypothetical protein EI94DRAFT_900289 [Lactarius quietus]|nr:hypothetical protein EI94DRAFT_900289 [Lactarius quietus]